MDIKINDLILLNDGMYYLVDHVNAVNKTVYLKYNNYNGVSIKERMSHIENGLKNGAYRLYRDTAPNEDVVTKNCYLNYNDSGGSKIGSLFGDKETAKEQSDHLSEDSIAIPASVTFKIG